MGEQAVFGIGKWKTEAWEGEVVDETQLTSSDSEGYDYTMYYLHVKMPDGTVQKKKYGQKLCEQFNVGDKIVKRPGEKKPVKA
jgi:hypothetical protein